MKGQGALGVQRRVGVVGLVVGAVRAVVTGGRESSRSSEARTGGGIQVLSKGEER